MEHSTNTLQKKREIFVVFYTFEAALQEVPWLQSWRVNPAESAPLSAAPGCAEESWWWRDQSTTYIEHINTEITH